MSDLIELSVSFKELSREGGVKAREAGSVCHWKRRKERREEETSIEKGKIHYI